MSEPAVPAGFARHFRQSPLTDPWEPLYSKREGQIFYLGVRVEEPHCNARGLAHGGLITALADNAMGIACILAAGREKSSGVTANLSVSFVGSVGRGQWLEVAAEPIKLGGTLAFAEARISAEGQLVARASAVFRILDAA